MFIILYRYNPINSSQYNLHMKKIIGILVLTIYSGFLSAQVFTLDVFNPAPRIGDKVELNYAIVPETSNTSTNDNAYYQSRKDIIARGSLSVTEKVKDTSDIKIGPLSMTVDGKTYKSDKIVLKVYPELPKVKKGFWIRFIELNKKFYIITEERRVNSIRTVPVRINFPKAPNKIDGIKSFQISKSTSSVAFSEETDKNIMYVTYINIYSIILDDGYNNNGVLTKENFQNVPDDLDIQPVKIKFN